MKLLPALQPYTLKTLLIVLSCALFFTVTHTVLAQQFYNPNTGDGITNTEYLRQQQAIQDIQNREAATASLEAAREERAAAEAAAAAANPNNVSGAGTSQTIPSQTDASLDDDSWEMKIKQFVYQAFISTGGMVTWAGGNLLDWSIQKLVKEFGSLLNENLGVGVNHVWTIVRDLINVVFIFMLIWIGLKTIFDADTSNLKKTLVSLIAAALLINFSLFIAKAVVDFTNIAAVQISQAFVVEAVGDGSVYNVSTSALGGVDVAPSQIATDGSQTEIAAAFMETMKLTSYASGLILDSSSIGFVVAFSFLIFFMMVIAGFVFAAGALLMIIRFVALVLLMMFSPLMFVGWIYPGLKSISSKWLGHFFKYSFIGPAYLFMLYIALALTGTGAGGFGFTNGAIANAVNDGSGGASFGIMLHFALVIGFLIAAVQVSRLMGSYGSNAVIKVGMAGANWSRGVVTGVGKGAIGGARASAAFGYRNTAGRAAAATNKKFDSAIGKKWSDRTILDRAAVSAARVGGGLNSAAGRRNLEGVENYKAFGGRSRKDVKEDEKYIKGKALDSTKAGEQEGYKNALVAVKDIDLTETKDGKSAHKEKIEKLTNALDNLTKEEIGKVKADTLANHKVAVHLTDKHLEKLKDSGSFSDEEIAKIKDAQKDALKAAATNDGVFKNALDDKGRTYAERVLQRKKEEVAKLPDEFFTNSHSVAYLTPSQLEAKLETKPSADTVKKIREAVQKHVDSLTATVAEGVTSADSVINANIANAQIKQWKNWSNKRDEGLRLGLKMPLTKKSGTEGWGDPVA